MKNTKTGTEFANDNAVEPEWKEQRNDPQLGTIIGNGLFARVITKVEIQKVPIKGDQMDGAIIHMRLTTRWRILACVHAWFNGDRHRQWTVGRAGL